jgi:hypothetical protein
MLTMCASDGRTGSDSIQRQVGGAVCEPDLPTCVRNVLAGARAARPESDVTCIAFRTIENGREIARVGPDAEAISPQAGGSIASCLRAKDLVVLSVTVTETTFETVRTVTHELIARTRRASGV